MYPEERKNNFRMTEVNFYRPVNLLGSFAREGLTKVCRNSPSLEKRLAITLYYLEDQSSMKMTVNSFGIPRCTVGRVVEESCTLISENIGPSFIVFPSEKNDVLNETSCFFQKFGFPQVIWCVDRNHIPGLQKMHTIISYISYTLNYKAICNAYGKFINFEIKWLMTGKSTRCSYIGTLKSIGTLHVR